MNEEFKNVVLADDELETVAGGADNGYPRKDNHPGPFEDGNNPPFNDGSCPGPFVYENDNGQPRYSFWLLF